MKKPLYSKIASTLAARENCIKTCKWDWEQLHRNRIEELVKNEMPSGSGIDCGTKLDLDASTPNKLVFTLSYHHMNADGYYDGWTEHKVIVTPSLAFGIDVRITGRDRNDIKEYLSETYHHALTQEIEF